MGGRGRAQLSVQEFFCSVGQFAPRRESRSTPQCHSAKQVRRMGAKLSRRKSEGAAAEGAVVEAPAQDQPATPGALSAPESSEQNLSGAEATPKEVDPLTDTNSKPVSEALECITQVAEETVNTISQQITAPVEDVLNKSIGAVEAMMAAVGIKDEITEPDESSDPKSETLVDLSEETTHKMIFSSSKPPEDLAYLPCDLVLSQPIPEALLTEPVAAAIAVDVSPVAVENEEIPNQFDFHAPPESKEFLACMKQDAEPPAESLNYEVSVDPSALNSDPLVDLGDMGQGVSTAVNTINDLI